MIARTAKRLRTSEQGGGEVGGKHGRRTGRRGLQVGRCAARCGARTGRAGVLAHPARRLHREELGGGRSPPERWSDRRTATGSRTPNPASREADRAAWPAGVVRVDRPKTTAGTSNENGEKSRRGGIARAVRGAGGGVWGEAAHRCREKPRSTASWTMARRQKAHRSRMEVTPAVSPNQPLAIGRPHEHVVNC